MRAAASLLLLVALAAAAPAAASESRPTQRELESELVCPVCTTTLDQSDAPLARRIKRVIARRIAAGDTKSEIKDALVAEFGESILAAPPRRGFNLLAWALPLAGLSAGAALVGLFAWRWRGARDARGDRSADGPLEPELDRRLDHELARLEA